MKKRVKNKNAWEFSEARRNSRKKNLLQNIADGVYEK